MGAVSTVLLRNVFPEQVRPAGLIEARPITLFDKLIEALMYALLAFAPAVMGVVHPWSEEVFVGACAAMALCLALKLTVRRECRFIWTWAYLPIALFVLLAVIQLVPLPRGLASLLSPKGVALRERLMADANGGLGDRVTLSFYRLGTLHELWMVLSYATIFVVVANVFQRRDQIRRLLLAIVCVAAAVAAVTVLQDLSGADRIYFIWPIDSGAARSGPFVNHSHFSQFMNLSIGAAIALALVRLRELASLGRFLPSSIRERTHLPEFRVVRLCAAVVVVGIATICFSMSRGGMLSAMLAASFVAIALARHQKLRPQGWLMMLLGLAVALGLGNMLLDSAYDRWIAAHHVASVHDRGQMLRDAIAACRVSPVVGTGLGTNGMVLPMFDRTESASVPTYADNDYAQTAIEMGMAGLLLAFVFIAMIWWQFARSARKTSSRTCAAAFGLAYGLVAVMVHSWSDYGQHIPAVATLTAISCGLLVVLARMQPIGEQEEVASASKSLVAAAVRLAGVLAVMGISGIALADLNAARLADAYAERAGDIARDLEHNNWDASNEVFASLITASESAANAHPGNIVNDYWLNVYRWRSISRVTDDQTGNLVLSDEQVGCARQIVRELHAIRRICPTYGPPYGLAGQIEAFVLNDLQTGAKHIHVAHELSPNSDVACFSHGLIDALQGKVESSITNMQKAVRLNGDMLDRAASVYVERVHRPDLAVTLANGNAQWLLHIGDLLSGQHPGLRQRARDEARELLLQECKHDVAPETLATAGMLCCEHQDYEQAIEFYRRALDSDYGKVPWRAELARALLKAGRGPEAVREAQICLRLDPSSADAHQIVQTVNLTAHPDEDRPAQSDRQKLN